MQQYINGIELHRLFENGYRNLKKNVQTINDLNVFPVPDGDTGTNMVKTFGGGLLTVSADIPHAGEYMAKLSPAVLLSARGNSGVIFSQFVHGLARGFADKQTITFADFADAFTCAEEDAYASILSPAEGTILTVIREAAFFLRKHAAEYDNLQDGLAALLVQMKTTLAKTPDLLPILKEAGVVDSGGAGLVCFTEGMLAHLCGESVEDTPELADTLAQSLSTGSFGPDSVLEYGYCTEFILQLMNAKCDIAAFDMKTFLPPLEEMGDSIVAVAADSIVKIHIHTFTPEKVLEYARRFGEFITTKIENMSVQHSETQAAVKPREHVKYAAVAVASGHGMVSYFSEIGAAAVIDGGQTNNPSVDAFLNAFEELDAEHIVVLPNNGNVIFTARQAAEMYTATDVQVIPTKSVAEGCSALSMMNPWCDTVQELIEDMSMGLDNVTTAYITTATRDTVMDGITVREGAYIGLADKTILSCDDDKTVAAETLLSNIPHLDEKEVVIVFSGKDATDDEVRALQNSIAAHLPDAEVAVIDGGQDVYDFIISLE